MSGLSSNTGKLLLGAAATAAFLYVSVATFDGWLRHGTDIFIASVQNGIAWCF
ncbi:hypothetical protein [uncultured Agrobacterium sp.]|uniref:hypothetical protein n=1 Tax=uncultured Agrobacterium sp. TaxID=157277 RepID=UPI0025DE6917|nr:hypothetical protein [uncultured Agrobacterium sp.]